MVIRRVDQAHQNLAYEKGTTVALFELSPMILKYATEGIPLNSLHSLALAVGPASFYHVELISLREDAIPLLASQPRK
jgi:hypothetical protein